MFGHELQSGDNSFPVALRVKPLGEFMKPPVSLEDATVYRSRSVFAGKPRATGGRAVKIAALSLKESAPGSIINLAEVLFLVESQSTVHVPLRGKSNTSSFASQQASCSPYQGSILFLRIYLCITAH